MEPFSEAAREKLQALKDKEARGEKVGWVDLMGICEPNPDLPECPREHHRTGLECSLPNHHDGPHRAEVTW